MWETSGFEMLFPGFDDLVALLMDDLFQQLKFPRIQTFICSQSHYRLNPEFRLAAGTRYMDMGSGFFSAKEKEPEMAVAKNCRAHFDKIPYDFPFRNRKRPIRYLRPLFLVGLGTR